MSARRLIEMALPSENHAHGFLGALLSGYHLRPRDADAVWDHASDQLLNALGGLATAQDVREFLDSARGRHLADALSFRVPTDARVEDYAAAVDAVITEEPWVTKDLRRFANQPVDLETEVPDDDMSWSPGSAARAADGELTGEE